MDSQNNLTSVLPITTTFSHIVDPEIDYINNFLNSYAQLNPLFQRELDGLLGFQIQCDPSPLCWRYDQQNDPHLFLRICFFLIGRSFPALQAWVAIPRLGFDCELSSYSNGTVDVLVLQSRDSYNIRMSVRLRNAATILDPPTWVLLNPLPVPLPYESEICVDAVVPVTQAETDGHAEGQASEVRNATSDVTSASPFASVPQNMPDPLDATAFFALTGEPMSLNDMTMSGGRRMSGFSWLTAFGATDSNSCARQEDTHAPVATSLPSSQVTPLSDAKANNSPEAPARTPTILKETPPQLSSEPKVTPGPGPGPVTRLQARLNGSQSSPGLLQNSTFRFTSPFQGSKKAAPDVHTNLTNDLEGQTKDGGLVGRVSNDQLSDDSTPPGGKATSTTMDVDPCTSKTDDDH